MHTGVLPITGLTSGVTVAIANVDPQPVTYDTVAVPIPAPLKIPPDVIVAIDAGTHVHIPPGTELPSAMLLPMHTGEFPLISPGIPFTVSTVYTAPQPVVYVTITVPAPRPVTTPVGATRATEVAAALHTPPASELPRVIVVPTQNGTLPVIGPGTGFIVTIEMDGPQDVE